MNPAGSSATRSGVTDVLAALAVDPSRPRFTGYTSLGRTELSGTVLRNWAAKVAGLLVDELGAGPADVVLVRSPANWQTAGVVLGVLWAGLSLTDDPDVACTAAFVPPADPAADVDAEEIFVVSGHPLGVPVGPIPAGLRDFGSAVLPQADSFRPRFAPDHGRALLTGGAATSLAALTGAVRAPSGLTVGQRVLTAGPWTLAGHDPALVRLLLRPLAAGASVVHVLDLDPAGDAAAWAHRAEVEHANVTIGVDVPGLRRIG